ncbi:heme A synthase [Streptomyces sp. NPDC093097]|uniref:COX15/CtaA family protein n=1 Tax=Streptomyces sp. NPDC093097 TaxID=3366027 RepID=UPI0037FE43A3
MKQRTIVQTPLSWLAGRFSLGPRSVRLASFVSVVAGIGIVATGGVVRVTGSGLGCTDWPMCTADTLAPTAEMGIHGVIEFGNRLLTGVLCVVVGWVIIAARLQSAPSRAVLRGAWAQFWVVVLNAVVGGVTVWMKLSPYVVAAHFLAAILFLTTTVVTWDRVRRESLALEGPGAGQGERPRLPERCRGAAGWLLGATALLLVAGTLATGAGPHAGDSSDVHRMPFNWTVVTVIHGALAVAALVLAGYLLRALPKDGQGRARQKALSFVAVVLAQGAVGVVQSLSGLPALAVGLHLLGSALVWTGAVQVFLATRFEAQPSAVGLPTMRETAVERTA